MKIWPRIRGVGGDHDEHVLCVCILRSGHVRLKCTDKYYIAHIEPVDVKVAIKFFFCINDICALTDGGKKREIGCYKHV